MKATHNIRQRKQFYVYTLAHPDGTIFYVGKGQYPSSSKKDRIDDHEREARMAHHFKKVNQRKIDVIKEIWASGHEVVKNRVAVFDDERDAYAYEWALINMTCYSDQLTNIFRAPSHPVEKRRIIEFPHLSQPTCLSRGKGLRLHVYHHIADIDEFCRKNGINRERMSKIINKEISSFKGWRLAVCDCGKSGDM